MYISEGLSWVTISLCVAVMVARSSHLPQSMRTRTVRMFFYEFVCWLCV